MHRFINDSSQVQIYSSFSFFYSLFYFFFFVICATLKMTDSWHGNHLRWCANRMNGTTGALLSQTNQSYCRLVCHFLVLSDEGLERHAGEHGLYVHFLPATCCTAQLVVRAHCITLLATHKTHIIGWPVIAS